MNERAETFKPLQDEEEIFKSLGHQIRRNILRLLGPDRYLSFSSIQKGLAPIDSPTLAYHLKNLSSLVRQEGNEYGLNHEGVGSYYLLNRIDQSAQFKKGNRFFIIANLIPLVSWVTMLFLIPYILSFVTSSEGEIFIIILIEVLAQVNFQVPWVLWGMSMMKSRRKRKAQVGNPPAGGITA